MSTDDQEPTRRKRETKLPARFTENEDPPSKTKLSVKAKPTQTTKTSSTTNSTTPAAGTITSFLTGGRDQSNLPVSQAKGRRASVEEVEDEDMPTRNLPTKAHKTYVVESDASEEETEVPPPSELTRASSRSSLASEADGMNSSSDEAPGGESSEDEAKNTPEDDIAYLDRMLPRWSASVYAFFDPRPEVEWKTFQPRGTGKMISRRYIKFRCSAPHCKSQGKNGRHVYRATVGGDKSSTKNLRSHVEGCWGAEALAAADGVKGVQEAREILKGRDNSQRDGSILEAFKTKAKLPKMTYLPRPPTKAEIKANHVCWVSHSKRPPEITDDPYYRKNMKDGRPQHYVPSPTTVRRDVKVAFAKARQKISDILRNVEGALHFATDCWTSPNNRAFMALTVHYEDKGKVVSWCLDIVELPKRHTGVRLAETLSDVLWAFGIEKKMLGCTCDNASANDVMVERHQYFVPEGHLGANLSEATRVRCFCHIINLVCKSLLAQFDILKTSKKRPVPPTKKKAKRQKVAEGPQEAGVGDDIAMEDGEEGVESEKDDEMIDSDLLELQDLAQDLDFEEKDAEDEADEEGVEKDNDDGWLDERLEMSPEEREELAKNVLPARRVLVKVRKVAYAVKNSSTFLLPKWKRFCRQVGLEERILPRDVKTRWNSSYDMLDAALEYRDVYTLITGLKEAGLRQYELEKADWKLVKELRDVLLIFKEATEFFSEKDKPHLSSVIPAMDEIDSDMATDIYKKKYSPPVTAALIVAKRTLNRYYSKTDLSETYRIAMALDPWWKLEYMRDAKWEPEWIATAEKLVRDAFVRYSAEDSAPQSSQTLAVTAAATTKPQNCFARLKNSVAGSSSASPSQTDEVTRWLSTPPQQVTDPLMWWHENAHLYPRLSKMARDYLSMPATSVEVERLFSKGRIILNHLRNGLKPENFRTLLCLGEWIDSGLLNEREIARYISGLPDLPEKAEDDGLGDNWDVIHK